MKQAVFICNPAEKTKTYLHPWRMRWYYNHYGVTLEPGDGLVFFRRDFDLPAGTVKTVVRATALGVFHIYLNGKKIGNEELKPGWTDYTSRVFEFSYDVTADCAAHNTLILPVAIGWWSGRISFGEYGNRRVAVAAEIECLDAEGNTLLLEESDDTWTSAIGGKVRTADIWDGEYIDATKKDPVTDPDAFVWGMTVTMDGKTPDIVPHVGEPVRVRPAFCRRPQSAVLWRETRDNGTEKGEIVPLFTHTGADCERATIKAGEELILDLGQEMVGRPKLALRAKRGTRVEIFVCELLNDSGDPKRGNDGPKGSMYIANYRTALARTVYIAAGEGIEICEPAYTFFGFRYFGIRVSDETEIERMDGIFVSTDMVETGDIVTSNPEVNRLIENIKWGQRANYLSIPTDCPQRDERLGWSGDTEIFCGTGTYNADARGFFKKWLGDARDGQRLSSGYWDVIPALQEVGGGGRTAWGDAGIIVPYMLYLKYNDVETLAEHYPSMVKYIKYLGEFGLHGPRAHYGDWLCYADTPKTYLSLCYYIYDIDLITLFAKLLGKEEDAANFAAARAKLQKEFDRLYIKDDTLTVASQTACLLALHFKLVRGKAYENTVALLEKLIRENDYTLSTGFIGTGILNQTLAEAGLDDLAYSLLLQTRDPSWIYSVRQGATTMWERWNSYTKETGFGKVNMNSFNHYAYGAVGEWMYAYMAGISPDPEAPGFRHFILTPRPDRRTDKNLPAGQERITFVKAHYDSYAGRIESEWRAENGAFTYTFTIPEGASARVELFVGETFTLNGKKIDAAALGGKRVGEKAVFELGAGTYTVR